ncbi:MAG: hypothetical protein AB7O96_17270 [Pseudobdellovibrionaceae bacterium]
MKNLFFTLTLVLLPLFSQAALNELFKERDTELQRGTQKRIAELIEQGVDICGEYKLDFSDEARSERDVRYFMVGFYFNEALRQLDEERNSSLATDGTLKQLEEAYLSTVVEGQIAAICSPHLDDK